MKQLYAYILPLAAAAWMLTFLPFSEGAIDYLLVGIGVVLAIAALILKQKEQTAGEEQQILALAEQQKSLAQIEGHIQTVGQAQVAEQQKGLAQIESQIQTVGQVLVAEQQKGLAQIESQVQTVGQALVTEQQQVHNQLNVFQTTLNELTITIINAVAQTKVQREEQTKVEKDILEYNANKQQEILEAFATKMIDCQQILAKNITSALDTQTTNLSISLNDLNRPLQDIRDEVKNLDENLNSEVKYLIEAVEEIPEGYQPLIEQFKVYSVQAKDYTEQMEYIKSQVVTSTQKQLNQLATITENLQLSVSELASSKHAERQQAMKVQSKLMEQYAKMK